MSRRIMDIDNDKVGELFSKANDNFEEVYATDAKQDSEIKTKATQADFNTLKARVDNLTQTPARSTEGNAELLDIRVGADGKTYPAAGEAVRSNFLRAKLLRSAKHLFTKNLFDLSKFIPDKEYKNGVLSDNTSGYGISDFIPVEINSTLYQSVANKPIPLNSSFIYEFDKDKKFLKSTIPSSDEYLVSSNAYYIVVCIHKSWVKTYQLEYDSMTEYCNYLSDDDILAKVIDLSVTTQLLDNYGVTRNLFNYKEFAADSELDSSGNFMPNSKGYGVSNFMVADPTHPMLFSFNNNPAKVAYLYRYSKSLVYLGKLSLVDSYTPDESTRYIRVCIPNTWINKFQAEYDNRTKYTSHYLLDIHSEDISELQRKLASRNLFDSAKFIPDKEYIQGVLSDNTNKYGVSDMILIESGRQIWQSLASKPIPLNSSFIYEFDKNKKFLKSTISTAASYTPSTNASYLVFCIPNSWSENFQVEYDKITRYTSYSTDTISDLLARTNYLEELKGFSDYTVAADNPFRVLRDDPGLLSCFLNVGCIGDSLASGVAVYKDSSGETVVNSVNRYQYSWGQYLARMTGNKYYNWSAGGLRTDTWLSSSYAAECFDGNHKCEAYIIGLGQNDNNAKKEVGSSADIDLSDYHNNVDSFYGRYAKIIQKILEIQPKAKIFVITDPNDAVDAAGYNEAIRYMATIFNNVYVIDMRTYWNSAPCAELLNSQKRYGHFNAVGYYLIAKMTMTYIDWIMQTNYLDFREIENIGTDYHWYE